MTEKFTAEGERVLFIALMSFPDGIQKTTFKRAASRENPVIPTGTDAYYFCERIVGVLILPDGRQAQFMTDPIEASSSTTFVGCKRISNQEARGLTTFISSSRGGREGYVKTSSGIAVALMATDVVE